MNRSSVRQSGLIAFALAAWLLAGCSSTPMSRIDKNRALYESWPVDMQSAVLEGNVVKDMTPDMVRMALGEPTRIEPKIGSTSGEETWIYEKGGGMNLPRPNISLGGNIGGLGVSTGRRGGGGGGSRNASSGAQEQEIVFQNGVVIRAG
jgi:hypothetical protein